MFPLAVISNAHSPHPPTKIKKKKKCTQLVYLRAQIDVLGNSP